MRYIMPHPFFIVRDQEVVTVRNSSTYTCCEHAFEGGRLREVMKAGVYATSVEGGHRPYDSCEGWGHAGYENGL